MKWKQGLAYLAYLGLSTFCLLLLLEVCLRLLFGLPRGIFQYEPLGNASLYRPNATLQMPWDLIPYTVHTNSLGFRGPEISREKAPDVVRVAALGRFHHPRLLCR